MTIRLLRTRTPITLDRMLKDDVRDNPVIENSYSRTGWQDGIEIIDLTGKEASLSHT